MKKSLIGLLALVALAPIFAHAIEIKTEQGSGSALTSKGNLYQVGGTVMVATTTSGDIYAAGGTLLLSGETTKDVVAAGGTVSVTGKVGEDLRMVGGTVIAGAPIGGDFVAAGGQVQIDKAATIGGDALIAAGNIKIDGSVAGSVRLAAGTVLINGSISKDLEVRANKLEFGPSAVVTGSVKYFGPQEAVIDQGAKVSNVTYTRTEQKKVPIAAGAGLSWLAGFIAVSALALVLYFLFDRKGTEQIKGSAFGKEVVRGLVILIVAPVAIFIGFITFVGWMLSLVALLIYILFIILSIGYAAILAARLLNQWLIKRPFQWWMVLVGVIALQILMVIPILGWIAYVIIFLASFGMLMNRLYLSTKN